MRGSESKRCDAQKNAPKPARRGRECGQDRDDIRRGARRSESEGEVEDVAVVDGVGGREDGPGLVEIDAVDILLADR